MTPSRSSKDNAISLIYQGSHGTYNLQYPDKDIVFLLLYMKNIVFF